LHIDRAYLVDFDINVIVVDDENENWRRLKYINFRHNDYDNRQRLTFAYFRQRDENFN